MPKPGARGRARVIRTVSPGTRGGGTDVIKKQVLKLQGPDLVRVRLKKWNANSRELPGVGVRAVRPEGLRGRRIWREPAIRHLPLGQVG